VEDLESGNSNMSEDDEVRIVMALRRYTRRDVPMSKAQACRHVGVGRSKFDSLVRAGALPRGTKREGFKELSWTRRDLDKHLKDAIKCQTSSKR